MANAAGGVATAASSYVASSAVAAGMAATATGMGAVTAGLASIGPIGWAVLAVGAIASIFGNSEEEDMEEARKITDKANTDAANRIRDGSNQKAAAVGSMQASQQSINNNNKLRAGGEQMNAISTNTARAFDEISRGSIERQVRASEEMGSMYALSGAAGVGGSSMKMLQQTMQFRNDRAAQTVSTGIDQYNHDTAMQKAGIMSNTMSGLDNNLYTASLDYSINQAPIRTEQSQSPGVAALTGVLGQVSKDPKFFANLLAPNKVADPALTVGQNYSPATYDNNEISPVVYGLSQGSYLDTPTQRNDPFFRNVGVTGGANTLGT